MLSYRSLKQKYSQFDEIFVAGCSGSCLKTTSAAASHENIVRITTISLYLTGWDHHLVPRGHSTLSVPCLLQFGAVPSSGVHPPLSSPLLPTGPPTADPLPLGRRVATPATAGQIAGHLAANGSTSSYCWGAGTLRPGRGMRTGGNCYL